MGVSNATADGLIDPILQLYRDAERILLERIARALGQGLASPQWAEKKLAEIQLLMARCTGDLNRLSGRTAEEIANAILSAWNRGAAIAAWDARDLVAAIAAGANPAGLPAVQLLIAETVTTVTGAHVAILRTVEDAYREVVARTAGQVLLGTQTRREAAQAALDEFAARGIGGFVDKAGRRWGMDTYAEMATRSAAGRAATDGHTSKLLELGHDLVIVSDSPRECEKCRPWEGKILSLSGLKHVGVKVSGTLEMARAQGLMHQNCTHSVNAYFDGITEVPTNTENPEGYEAKQRQREIERKIREWKRREVVALDERAREYARTKVRYWQAQARANVAETGTKRLPAREQIGKAH